MARIIRFPLKMKNGAEVRSLDELKENFDLESVIGYFADGMLQKWLSDRYYDEKAEAVAALSKESPDFNQKLCNILEVEYTPETDNIDLDAIQRRNEKYRILSTITADQDILNNVNLVAMNQDELNNLYFIDTDKIYLYGEKFEIPFGRKNTHYIGLNEPLAILGRNKTIFDYESEGITFSNISFEKDANPNGEELFIAGKYLEAFPFIERAANNGNPRDMYLMGLYYYWGYDTVMIDINKRDYWFEKGYLSGEPLGSYWFAKWCIKDDLTEQNRIYLSIIDKIRTMADGGDSFAQHTLGSIYDNGRGISKDRDMAIKYYRLSAEQGNALGQFNLGSLLFNYKNNKAEGAAWIIKSAEQGLALGQYNLGVLYENGDIVGHKSEAVMWLKMAKDQGYVEAKNVLKNMGITNQYDLGLWR